MSNEIIYYIHINGEQKGPFNKEALPGLGLKPNSMVWRSDLPNWVEARTLPELVELLNETSWNAAPPQQPPRQAAPSNPYPQSQQGGFQTSGPYCQPQSPGYGGYQNNDAPRYPGQFPPGWRSWLGWAIVGTIFGGLFTCVGFITGIIGIVYAAQANSDAKLGNMMSAESKNSTAKILTIISLVLAGIGLIACVAYIGMVGSILSLAAL